MAACFKGGLLLCIVILCIEADASFLDQFWKGGSDSYQSSEFSANAQASDAIACSFVTGALETCHSAKVLNGEETDFFHVCPKDGDPCDPQFCYFTGIRPCCAGALLTECKSTSKLLLHETVINVTFYNVRRPGLSDVTCFVVEPTIDLCDEDCQLQCAKTPLCTNNTVSCDESGNCVCVEGFEPPDCCNCTVANETHGWYKAPNGSCLPYCIRNCRTKAPDGSCSSCHGGFEIPSCCNCPNGKTEINGICKCDGKFLADGTCIEGYLAPNCCECDTTGNETHAFYEEDGECKPFCKLNCAVRGSSGCDTCKDGYVVEPECCDCDTQGNSTHAYYRTDNGECKPFCKLNCAVRGDSGCDTCKDGYVDEPECCDCDTEGNSTHAYYRTDTGECKPFCKLNCAVRGDNGCDTCKDGYVDEPECCDCDTEGNSTHAYYRTDSGECKPFCKLNCAVRGDNGCNTCKTGYVDEPECCDCDTEGNSTHAYYKTDSGECKPFCKLNCAVRGDNGCNTCKTGYVDEPECCACDTEGNSTHAYYKTDSGECKPFCKLNCAVRGDNGCNTCKAGYVDEPECCACDTEGNSTHAYYKTDSGECKPFCKLNCAVRGDNGCDTCKAGYVDEPECCDCDTQGNSTHAYYKTDSGECKPYCKNNCAQDGGIKGCLKCKDGFAVEPTCCEETKCEKDQTLYFLIDVSISNEYHQFCRLMTVAQLLVAAFNPSPSRTPNTEVSARVFSRHDIAPLEVFSTSDNCNDIVSDKIPSVMEQYRKCKSGTLKLPPFCGDETYAINGLNEIAKDSETVSGQPEALILLTGGIISTKATDDEDPAVGEKNLNDAIQSLTKSGVTIRIAAQSDDERDPGLLKYVSQDANALDNSNPIDLGVEIVNRLREENIICRNHAEYVIGNISATNEKDLDNYCKCIESRSGGKCEVAPNYFLPVKYTFPTCGGSLAFGVSAAVNAQENDKGSDSESLEQDILAAVKNVLEGFTG